MSKLVNCKTRTTDTLDTCNCYLSIHVFALCETNYNNVIECNITINIVCEQVCFIIIQQPYNKQENLKLDLNVQSLQRFTD